LGLALCQTGLRASVVFAAVLILDGAALWVVRNGIIHRSSNDLPAAVFALLLVEFHLLLFWLFFGSPPWFVRGAIVLPGLLGWFAWASAYPYFVWKHPGVTVGFIVLLGILRAFSRSVRFERTSPLAPHSPRWQFYLRDLMAWLPILAGLFLLVRLWLDAGLPLGQEELTDRINSDEMTARIWEASLYALLWLASVGLFRRMSLAQRFQMFGVILILIGWHWKPAQFSLSPDHPTITLWYLLEAWLALWILEGLGERLPPPPRPPSEDSAHEIISRMEEADELPS